MSAVDSNDKPLNIAVTASLSTFTKEGLVLIKDSAVNTLSVSTTVDDTIQGILDQPIIDDTGTVRATRSGESTGVFLVGSGKIVYVASLTGMTWALGAAVYNGQTAGTAGVVNTDSSNSATKIGHYVGVGVVTVDDYELIPVLLDVANGG